MPAIFTALTILFALLPLYGAYAVHDETGTVRCLDCHTWLPLEGGSTVLNDGGDNICAGCHKDSHVTSGGFSHVTHAVPSMDVPPDMPLDRTGGITCFTCHTYHSGYRNSKGEKNFFLRRSQGKTFCYSCHKKRLF
ncbi:MAG: cytochrome c3 family protein [Nitrospirae bacterium]|nr:cytochrome c3 family protein [Nitrospirota bacterium]